MVYTTIEVDILLPNTAIMVLVLRDDLHPSKSMSRMSFSEAGHMHESIYLHAKQIDKMNNIGLLDSKPYSSCNYILHVSAHRLGICGTMVRYHNSVGSAPQMADNFESQGKYL